MRPGWFAWVEGRFAHWTGTSVTALRGFDEVSRDAAAKARFRSGTTALVAYPEGESVSFWKSCNGIDWFSLGVPPVSSIDIFDVQLHTSSGTVTAIVNTDVWVGNTNGWRSLSVPDNTLAVSPGVDGSWWAGGFRTIDNRKDEKEQVATIWTKKDTNDEWREFLPSGARWSWFPWLAHLQRITSIDAEGEIIVFKAEGWNILSMILSFADDPCDNYALIGDGSKEFICRGFSAIPLGFLHRDRHENPRLTGNTGNIWTWRDGRWRGTNLARRLSKEIRKHKRMYDSNWGGRNIWVDADENIFRGICTLFRRDGAPSKIALESDDGGATWRCFDAFKNDEDSFLISTWCA